MTPTLHLICGKIAAGKSTLAARLAAEPGTILISEDDWLSRLYPDEQKTIEDYARNAQRLRGPMGDHIVALLQAGLSVVLDFPANTVIRRKWMRGLFERAGVAHQLHFLDPSDDVCIERLHVRNAAGTHAFTVTDEEYAQFTAYFVPPTADEGFEIKTYRETASRA